MSRRSTTRISPSGRALTLRWEGEEVVSNVSGVHFAGGSYGRAFQIAPAGAHDFAATHLVPADVVHRRRLGRLELRVSVAKDAGSTFASLIGGHHELMTVFSGPAPDPATIAELFGVLDIADDPHGMRVTPQRATGLTVAGEHVFVQNADSASIDVPAPQFSRELLPRRAGIATRRGEAWRSRLPGRRGDRVHDYAYTVGTPKGVAEVAFADPEAISDEAALAVVDSLDVSWSS